LLFKIVEDKICEMGEPSFSEKSLLSTEQFLRLLKIYLSSTVIKKGTKFYTQKAGVCIGSKVAPVLSALYLEFVNKQVFNSLRLNSVDDILILNFVDYLVITSSALDTASVKNTFEICGSKLTFTEEKADDRGTLRFLDLRIFSSTGLCVAFSPRSSKPLLPFGSFHSRIVKDAVAINLLGNASRRSCVHHVQSAIEEQMLRLKNVGFPDDRVLQYLVRLTRRRKSDSDDARKKSGFTVVPFLHGGSHSHRVVAGKFGVKLCFSYPMKLSKLLVGVHDSGGKSMCPNAHSKPPLDVLQCRNCLVYLFFL